MPSYRHDKIRGRMAEMEITVLEMSARAGVSDRTLYAIRKGRPVSARSLEKVARVLGMTMAEVYEPRRELQPAA